MYKKERERERPVNALPYLSHTHTHTHTRPLLPWFTGTIAVSKEILQSSLNRSCVKGNAVRPIADEIVLVTGYCYGVVSYKASYALRQFYDLI
jgi:hypothetical protein